MTEPTNPNAAEPTTPPARRFGVDDGLLASGTALISIGGWLAWRPLAFFLPGVIAIALAFLVAARARR